MSLRSLAAGVIAMTLALPLAGCGKLGELDRPGPLSGAGAQNRQAADPTPRVGTVDPRDRANDPTPQ